MLQMKSFLVGLVVFTGIITQTFAQFASSQPTSQPTTQPVTSQPSPKMIQLNFPPNMEIRVLAEYVGRRMGVNILYDDAVGRKRVTILATTKIPEDSLVGLFQSVLKQADLQLIDAEQPGWKKIVASRSLLEVTKGVETDQSKLANLQATNAISQVFVLDNTTTPEIERVLQPFLSKPGGNSFSIPNKNMIVVTDYADNVRRISNLIAFLDTPHAKTDVHFIPVKHLPVTELARQATALLQEKRRVAAGTGTPEPLQVTLMPEIRTNQLVLVSAAGAEQEVLDLIRSLDIPSNAETRTYRFRYVSPSRVDRLARDLTKDAVQGEVKTTVDPDSGMLIVTAPSMMHMQIEALARELDVPEGEQQTSNIRFYKLMNTTAAQALATIRALETGDLDLAALTVNSIPQAPGIPVESFSGPNNPPNQPGEFAPKPPTYRTKETPTTAPARSNRANLSTKVRDAVITADPNTNTIIVVASPNTQRIYEHLIKMLDKRRPQVMVEVTLITLDTSGGFSLGVEMGGKISMGTDSKMVLFDSFGLSTPDADTGSLVIEPGTGFNGVLISPDTVNIVLRALATSGRATVLSAPKVLVNDNSTATLSSVSEAPFTSINASETVSTTSFAGYASAGTTIAVTPHISEGDHLQVEYSLTLNSFTGEGEEGVPPPRQTNNINSEVTVPDGYAVIVGGLTRKNYSETVSKVPWLGDIPILKHAFSMTSTNDTESTLFVFIRPVILRDDQFEDLKYLSGKDLAAAGLPAHYPTSDPMLMIP